MSNKSKLVENFDENAHLGISVVSNSTISDLIDYIENQEYNYLNKELLDFANDVQNKLKAMIHK